MKEKLIIVESPSKAKTIQSYVGDQALVISSKGHIRDLAVSGKGGLGIDVEQQFQPNYTIIKGKQQLVKDLKAKAKGRDVLIATDPDREGEAIGWHIAKELELDTKDKNRVVFSEITKNKILEAIEHPRTIDEGLVQSQEARRILDRIIGFKLSTLLQNKIKSKSAGRVQSVALKLIVELEKEIRAFIPETFYDIDAVIDGVKVAYQVGKKRLSLEEATKIVSTCGTTLNVDDVKEKLNKRAPKQPFKTSTMQQDAASHLGFSASRTMLVAQKLYEGIEIDGEIVGLITYMRTDSTRLSSEFVKDAMHHIESEFGKKYLGSYTEVKDEKAQDAHEGIRPTKVYLTPEYVKGYLESDEYKLYTRIYGRALASLMAPAELKSTKVIFNGNGYLFQMEGMQLIFDGFLKVYEESKNKDVLLKPYKVGEQVIASEIIQTEKQTQPKARYNEASLIKELDSLGIGRPSTYASIIKTLKDRDYVELNDQKRFVPTDQGILTSDQLDLFFNPIINVSYTAQMEDDLDHISDGKKQQLAILSSFYDQFIPMLETAQEKMEKIKPKMTDEICPQCGLPLVIRKSKYGEFMACSGFPKCRYIKQEPKPVKSDLSEETPSES
jgi:DNA topoisomerase I